MAGQEIYAMLRNRADVDIEVESMGSVRCICDCDGRPQHYITDWYADDPLRICQLGIRKSSGHGKDGGSAADA